MRRYTTASHRKNTRRRAGGLTPWYNDHVSRGYPAPLPLTTMTDPTRPPQLGDLYQVRYEERKVDGTLLAQDQWCQTVIDVDVGPYRQLRVLLPDGSQTEVRRDDVTWGIHTGWWKLISPVCSSDAL